MKRQGVRDSAGAPSKEPVGREGLEAFLAGIALEYPRRDDIMMVCIGSDRSTGDAFGPLIGTYLSDSGWPHVVGTLREPCDAHRLETVIAGLPADKLIIAFDACLGKPDSVGGYLAAREPLRPAEAVGKRYPPIGDCSIAGVVGRMGIKPYWVLQSVSLHMVMEMARSAAEAVAKAWPGFESEFRSAGK